MHQGREAEAELSDHGKSCELGNRMRLNEAGPRSKRGTCGLSITQEDFGSGCTEARDRRRVCAHRVCAHRVCAHESCSVVRRRLP